MEVLPVITTESQLNTRLARRRQILADSRPLVADILSQVQEEGDTALRRLTEKYDSATIDNLSVPAQLMQSARAALPDQLEAAILAAAENIRRFHEKQLPAGFEATQPDGTEVAWRWRPIRRVGIYIPGGRYPLLSSILMNVIPAQVAGVAEIAICTPPGPSGYPSEALLGTCALLGIREVYRIGGAQAIAALAYGTESIPAVDKITGPGNAYVTRAKQLVSDQVGIDMAAGPTEVVVLADESANPRWIATDLISQAEHDPLAWPVLITDSPAIAREVNRQLPRLLSDLPTRNVAEAALREQGFAYTGDDLAACITAVNRISPEHLCLQVKQPESLIDKVMAGAIFLGQQTPVAWGDYWAGPNHTLPTAGQSRFAGPLSVYDFLTPYSVIEAPAQAVHTSGDKLKLMADVEGLAGHVLSITLREETDG